MSSAATPAPKVSFLKHLGQVIGKILGIVATKVAPEADIAAKVAEAMLPQFSTEIQFANNLIDNIAKEAVAAEAMASAAGTAAGTGAQKLEAALVNSGPAIDAWVASRFPGATQVSNASKAGLVSAVVTIMNELQPASASTPATPAA